MTKGDLDQLDQLIQKRLKIEIDPLNQRLEGQDQRFTKLEEQITDVKKDLSTKFEKQITNVKQDLSDQISGVKKDLSFQITREAEDIAGIISDAIIPKLDQHSEQIAELQEEAGLKSRKH